MAKTHYLEKHGIRVDGCRTMKEAREAWIAARDEFVDRATACPPWIFAFRGHFAVLSAEPHSNSWSYTIACPDDEGRRFASCFFSAPSQIAAIAITLGAMAQRAWSRDIADDGDYFDSMVRAARLTAAEASKERADFVHVAAFWRQHPSPQGNGRLS
jgi:hypothetical protein